MSERHTVAALPPVWDPAVDEALLGEIRDLSERREKKIDELEGYRRSCGYPEACDRLHCDPNEPNLRCCLLRGHEGPGNVWATVVPKAQREFRERHMKGVQSDG